MVLCSCAGPLLCYGINHLLARVLMDEFHISPLLHSTSPPTSSSSAYRCRYSRNCKYPKSRRFYSLSSSALDSCTSYLCFHHAYPSGSLTNICSGCLTSILRLNALYALSVSTDYVCKCNHNELFLHVIMKTNILITDDVLEAAIWSLAETNVGFICACVPTLKPLISALLPHLMSEKHVREISPTVQLPCSSPRNSHSRQLQSPDGAIGVALSRTTLSVSSMHGKRAYQQSHQPFSPSHNAYAQFDVEGQGEMPNPERQQGIIVTTSVVQDVDRESDIFGDPSGEESDNASTRGLRMS